MAGDSVSLKRDQLYRAMIALGVPKPIARVYRAKEKLPILHRCLSMPTEEIQRGRTAHIIGLAPARGTKKD